MKKEIIYLKGDAIGFQNHSLTYTFKILKPKIVMHAREHLKINALFCMKIVLRFMNKLKFELVSLYYS